MQNEGTIDQVNQLIELGKEKGFLTYEEVNDLLPSDILSPKQIDEMMIMFGEMNIEIGEVVQKAQVPKQKVQELPEKGNGEVKEGPGKAAFDNVNDPASIYLREMGAVSLLSREEEVEIAKRIEEGEKEIAAVVFHSPLTIKEIIAIGESLKLNNLSVREVIRGLDDEETAIDEEQHQKSFSLIERITRRERKFTELRKQLTQRGLSKVKKIELQRRWIEVLERSSNL